MKTLRNLSTSQILKNCSRPALSMEKIAPVIEEVFAEVNKKGDEALIKYTRFFDKVQIESFRVKQSLITQACERLSPALKEAIQTAANNIETFHSSQQQLSSKVETTKGVSCWQESRAIENVGIYIPGGSAPLFSTVLMLAVPAKIAGCDKIVLCSPPNKNGLLDDAILYAAELSGVDEIYAVGGSQAIAALTFGTESIPKVDKIFGPGNQFVTAAKVFAQQYGMAIDMPAGPSELMVVADGSANPEFVVSDLLSQAEHGPDSQVLCVLLDSELETEIREELELQLSRLPRAGIATLALENSKIILLDDRAAALELINGYGPEHLILMCADYSSWVAEIRNAGSVFLGKYTPESAGDYASGTNHTLPTGGAVKAYSGVNLDAFLKKITFQEITAEGILNLGPTVEIMAEAEQLEAHKNAVTVRLKTLKNEN